MQRGKNEKWLEAMTGSGDGNLKQNVIRIVKYYFSCFLLYMVTQKLAPFLYALTKYKPIFTIISLSGENL